MRSSTVFLMAENDTRSQRNLKQTMAESSVCHENRHDAEGPQAYKMKIGYPWACCNNMGRQGCPNFGTGIPS